MTTKDKPVSHQANPYSAQQGARTKTLRLQIAFMFILNSIQARQTSPHGV